MKDRNIVEALLAAEELLIERKKKRNPAYFKGLSGSTASKRSAQFDRQSKMSDDNPAAYKLAPGDHKETKRKSKWNDRFKDMYGEEDVSEFAPSSSGSVDLGVSDEIEEEDIGEFAPSSSGSGDLGVSDDITERIIKDLLLIAESLSSSEGTFEELDFDESSMAYAAAKAAAAGEPTFKMGGKEFKTKISKKKAQEILDGEEKDISEEDEITEALLQIAEMVMEEGLSQKTRKALKNKAEKANAPMGALTSVYNKGLAAWRTGHRPGASQHAWAMARVNSFLAGGPARRVDAAQGEKVKKHRKKKKS